MGYYYANYNGKEYRATTSVNCVCAYLQVFLDGERIYHMYYDKEKQMRSKMRNYPAKKMEWKEWLPEKMRREDWNSWDEYTKHLGKVWKHFLNCETLTKGMNEQ